MGHKLIKFHWTGQQNTELQSNQTEAGTALAMAMAALYYRFLGAFPHHLQMMILSGHLWVTCSIPFFLLYWWKLGEAKEHVCKGQLLNSLNDFKILETSSTLSWRADVFLMSNELHSWNNEFFLHCLMIIFYCTQYENTALHIKCTKPNWALVALCICITFENTSGVVTKTTFCLRTTALESFLFLVFSF